MAVYGPKVMMYAVLGFFWVFLSVAVWFGIETVLHLVLQGADDQDAEKAAQWVSGLSLPLLLLVFGLIIFWRRRSPLDDIDAPSDSEREDETENTP